MNSFSLPPVIGDLTEALESKGHHTWVVGGALRNHLLGQPITDWDLATQATPEQMLELWPQAIDIGRAFGAMGIPTKEGLVQITTLRTESTYKNHRRPHHVVFTDSIEKDLQRRDFTVNAMAYRPATHQWLDPMHGKQDIQSLRLRSVGDAHARIQEDALRMLRAFRLASQYGFALDTSLKEAIDQHKDLLEAISGQRVAHEIHPLLLAPHAFKALILMQKVGLYPSLLGKLSSSNARFDHLPTNLPLRCLYLLIQTGDLTPAHLLSWHLDREDHQMVTKLIELWHEPLEAKQKLLWLAWAKRLDIHHLITTLQAAGLDHVAAWLQDFANHGYEKLFYAFPVQGKALMAHLKLEQGRAIGQSLTALKEYYVQRPAEVAGKSIENLVQSWYNAS